MNPFFPRAILLAFMLSWGTVADARQAANALADAPGFTEVERRKSHFNSDRQKPNESSGKDSKTASPTVHAPRDSFLGMEPTVGLFVAVSAFVALAVAIVACAKDGEREGSTLRPSSGPPDTAQLQPGKKTSSG